MIIKLVITLLVIYRFYQQGIKYNITFTAFYFNIFILLKEK